MGRHLTIEYTQISWKRSALQKRKTVQDLFWSECFFNPASSSLALSFQMQISQFAAIGEPQPATVCHQICHSRASRGFIVCAAAAWTTDARACFEERA